jgi:NitT/TauT family transport system substrate-binding protein
MTPWRVVFFGIVWILTTAPVFAAEIGGKPEKSDVVVSYAQPSGAFTPIWVAYEAGLFKKHGLNAKLQLLTPQVSAQAVISEEVDFYTDGPDLINARLRGGQVKYFGGTMQQLVFQIWGAKEFKSIQELKGKTIAASTPRAALDTRHSRGAEEERLGSGSGRTNPLRANRARNFELGSGRKDGRRYALGAEYIESKRIGAEHAG